MSKIDLGMQSFVLGTNLLYDTNRKPYAINWIVPLSMTLINHWPWFQGHIEYLRKGTMESHSYYEGEGWTFGVEDKGARKLNIAQAEIVRQHY